MQYKNDYVIDDEMVLDLDIDIEEQAPIDIIDPTTEMLLMVHEVMDQSKWTYDDFLYGKEIDIFSEWKYIAERIYWDYFNVGWDVKHYIDGKREYIHIRHPNFANKRKKNNVKR